MAKETATALILMAITIGFIGSSAAIIIFAPEPGLGSLVFFIAGCISAYWAYDFAYKVNNIRKYD